MINALQNIKKVVIVIAVLLSVKSNACDLCGCTTSSGSFGFGDLSTSNFIGFRFIHQRFDSKNGLFINSPMTSETFNTYQIWTRVPLNEKFHVSAIIPYQNLHRKHSHKTDHLKGLGDINIMTWYKITFNKKVKVDSTFYVEGKEKSGHSISIGGGIKLPTGEFEQRLTDRINPGFQVGTGSLDYVASLAYNYGKNRFGMNITASYYLKTENKNDYRFGNQFAYASSVFYNFNKKEVLIRPFVSISGDVFSSIEQYGAKLPDTKGSIVNSSLGTEIGYKKFITGVNYTKPIAQNLFGNNVKAKTRFSVYINYNF